VHPDIDKGCRGTENARKPCPARDAVGCTVAFQERKCLLRVPAGMTEFHRCPDPPGKPFKKVSKALMVGGEVVGELDEKDPEFSAEEAEAMADPVNPFLRLGQPLVMGQRLGSLYGHQEAVGEAFVPGSECGIARPAVVAVVDFNCVEVLNVVFQPAGDGKFLRIESPFPVFVAPPRCAHMDGHGVRQVRTALMALPAR